MKINANPGKSPAQSPPKSYILFSFSNPKRIFAHTSSFHLIPIKKAQFDVFVRLIDARTKEKLRFGCKNRNDWTTKRISAGLPRSLRPFRTRRRVFIANLRSFMRAHTITNWWKQNIRQQLCWKFSVPTFWCLGNSYFQTDFGNMGTKHGYSASHLLSNFTGNMIQSKVGRELHCEVMGIPYWATALVSAPKLIFYDFNYIHVTSMLRIVDYLNAQSMLIGRDSDNTIVASAQENIPANV